MRKHILTEKAERRVIAVKQNKERVLKNLKKSKKKSGGFYRAIDPARIAELIKADKAATDARIYGKSSFYSQDYGDNYRHGYNSNHY